MDVKTIDEMTEFSFRDEKAKRRWVKLVEEKYFDNYEMHVTMDFTRRWGKLMQYKMKHENKSLISCIVKTALDANIDSAITKKHLENSIVLLCDVWFYGNEFQKWINSGGSTIIKAHF